MIICLFSIMDTMRFVKYSTGNGQLSVALLYGINERRNVGRFKEESGGFQSIFPVTKHVL